MSTVVRELDDAVAVLRATGAAAQVYDHEGRMYWVSEELMRLAGAETDEEVALGERVDGDAGGPAWSALVGEEEFAALRVELTERLATDAEHPVLWGHPGALGMTGRRLRIDMLGITLRAADGALAGSALLYAPSLPARVLALVSEGDRAMFARMADLTTPAQRPAAVLFADLDSSGPLSRRLPTAAYFELIRGLTTAFDDLVAEHGGIVGKHAGDGASAFFLAETHSSDAAAARAGLATALALPAAVRTQIETMAAAGLEIGDEAARFNVGLHWGANLYLGQVVTGGRLEVTALGDEVNECARIEQTATGGQILVSKTLVERLDAEALAGLGLRSRSLLYRTLTELAAGAKALRDAGSLAVVDLSAAASGS